MRLPKLASRFSRPPSSFRRELCRPIRSESPALVCPGPASDPARPGGESSAEQPYEASGSVRVLLVDDHVLVRAGVRTLLEERHAFEVVGEAREGIEALELMAGTAPRVVVMDLIMPGLGGLETTRQIRERHPATDVVILSMYCDEEQVQLALEAGARGFVRKGAEVSRLAEAIHHAAEGHLDFGDVISDERLQELLAHPPKQTRYESLTRRERVILHLAAWGYSSGRIAETLAISPRTVETHRAHLLHKLGLRNQVELVFFAIRQGVLTPDAVEAMRARDRMTH
jgi:two-component system, NarL family, response regulator NreC